MTSIQCLNFLDHPKKTPPQKDFAFFSFSPRKCRKCGSAAHLPFSTSNLKPGTSEIFLLQIDEEAMNQSRGFLVILKKYVHIKKGSYKHM